MNEAQPDKTIWRNGRHLLSLFSIELKGEDGLLYSLTVSDKATCGQFHKFLEEIREKHQGTCSALITVSKLCEALDSTHLTVDELSEEEPVWVRTLMDF